MKSAMSEAPDRRRVRCLRRPSGPSGISNKLGSLPRQRPKTIAPVFRRGARVNRLFRAREAGDGFEREASPQRTQRARVAISQHAVPPEVDDSRKLIDALETELEIMQPSMVFIPSARAIWIIL